MHLSVPEYAGSTPAGLEMKKLVHEIWGMNTQPKPSVAMVQQGCKDVPITQ